MGIQFPFIPYDPWLSYSTPNSPWPCPEAVEPLYPTRYDPNCPNSPNFSLPEGGASAGRVRPPQAFPLGDAGSLHGDDPGMGWPKGWWSQKVSFESWVLLPHLSLCIPDLSTWRDLDTIPFIQENLAPHRSFGVLSFKIWGSRLELLLQTGITTEKFHVCDIRG